MNNTNAPAMPQSVTHGPDGGIIASYDFADGAGLTKREYFAGLAMQGVLASDINFNMDKHDVADQAVQHADALLAELEKQS